MARKAKSDPAVVHIYCFAGLVGWNWEDEDIFADIGSFKEHFRNVEAGFFRPELKPAAKKIKSRKFNSLRQYYAELKGETIEDDDLVMPDDVHCPQIPLIGWSVGLEIEVELHLQ